MRFRVAVAVLEIDGFSLLFLSISLLGGRGGGALGGVVRVSGIRLYTVIIGKAAILA